MDSTDGRLADTYNLAEVRKTLAFLEKEKNKYHTIIRCRKLTISHIDVCLSVFIGLTALCSALSAGLVSTLSQQGIQNFTVISAVFTSIVLTIKGCLIKLNRDITPIKALEKTARQHYFDAVTCMSSSIDDDIISHSELQKMQEIHKEYLKQTEL